MSSSTNFRMKFARQTAAQHSDDRSTQTGALIVSGDGARFVAAANTFPIGVNGELDARHERPAKYEWIEHAERNAIYRCANRGFSTYGAKMYTTHHPCADCARAVIQAGIKELYIPAEQWNGDKAKQWGFDRSFRMLEEAGVTVIEVTE